MLTTISLYWPIDLGRFVGRFIHYTGRKQAHRYIVARLLGRQNIFFNTPHVITGPPVNF